MLPVCAVLFLIGHVLGWGLNPDRHLQLARLDEAAVDQFNRVLAERTGNEDCQVVTLVHLRGEGGRLTEMERTNVAISMTLCALISARQPCPQECSRWAPAAAESAMDITRALQSQCLSALHRSPQDWTTFNGYLSDAILLWSALTEQFRAGGEKASQYLCGETRLLEELRTAERNRAVAFTRLQGQWESQHHSLHSMIDKFESLLSQLQARSSDTFDLTLAALARERHGLRGVLNQEFHQLRESLHRELRDTLGDHQLALSTQVSSDVEAFVEALYLNQSHLVSDYTAHVWQSVSLLGSSAKDVSEVAHAQLGSLQALIHEAQLFLTSELQTMSKNTADLSPQIIQALENTKMLSRQQQALQSSMAHSLMLAENAKVSLERLNTSITSFVNVVTAPWTIIPVWSVLRAVFAMGPNILRAAWTVICSVSTSTSFETVPLLFLGRWLLNIALRQLRRTKSYRNVTLQRRSDHDVKRAGFPVARHPIQELERRVQLGRRAFSEAL